VNNRQPCILVVDDEELLLGVLRDFLVDEGYAVLSARSGAEAMKLLAAVSVDVCFVDMQLIDMAGDDLIRLIHEHKPEIRFIIHTGSPAYVLPRDLRGMGVSAGDVFIKPVFDMNVFVKAIERLLHIEE